MPQIQKTMQDSDHDLGMSASAHAVSEAMKLHGCMPPSVAMGLLSMREGVGELEAHPGAVSTHVITAITRSSSDRDRTKELCDPCARPTCA